MSEWRFPRLYTPFFSHDGKYIIGSAKPGYELIGEGSSTHVWGASHGGLHKQDSFVSMIISGTASSPDYKRILDVKDWLYYFVIYTSDVLIKEGVTI